MKQEDKELLLRDLCSKLPYGTKGLCTEISTQKVYAIEGVCVYYRDVPIVHLRDQGLINMPIMYVRPYLFPLSSMTKEQKEELENLGWYFDNFEIHNVSECLGTYREYIAHSDCFALIDWLNKNHFDYRGLIEKSLALDATSLNIY